MLRRQYHLRQPPFGYFARLEVVFMSQAQEGHELFEGMLHFHPITHGEQRGFAFIAEAEFGVGGGEVGEGEVFFLHDVRLASVGTR